MKQLNKIKQALRPLLRIGSFNFMQKLRLERFKKSSIIIASIAVFLSLNLLFSYISIRADLSKGQAYTLSRSTKNMVKELSQKATIMLYASNNIPARLQPIQREVIDLLREYERTSGNVTVSIVEFNPVDDVKTLEKVQQAGISGFPIREQQQSEVSVTEIYFGIIVSYDKKQEVVAQALDVENLEYNLTSALFRMSSSSLPQVAVIGGDPLSIFKQVAGNLFSIQPMAVDTQAKTLLVLDQVETDITDDELATIAEYSKKGNTIIMTDGETVDGSTLQTASGEAKFHEFISTRGIVLNRDLVLSTQSEMVNLGGGGFSLLVPYPLWVVSGNFNTEASYFSGIGRLTFPWASSLEVIKKNGYTVRPIVQTSGEAWTQSDIFALDPQQIPQPRGEELGEFTLAAESTADAGNKMLVIGSSRFLQSQFLSRESQNMEFLMNVLSDYASDGKLSGIGRRIVSLYPLPNLQQSMQEFYKYANILGLPLIFAAYGAYRLMKRR